MLIPHSQLGNFINMLNSFGTKTTLFQLLIQVVLHMCKMDVDKEYNITESILLCDSEEEKKQSFEVINDNTDVIVNI